MKATVNIELTDILDNIKKVTESTYDSYKRYNYIRNCVIDLRDKDPNAPIAETIDQMLKDSYQYRLDAHDLYRVYLRLCKLDVQVGVLNACKKYVPIDISDIVNNALDIKKRLFYLNDMAVHTKQVFLNLKADNPYSDDIKEYSDLVERIDELKKELYEEHWIMEEIRFCLKVLNSIVKVESDGKDDKH